MASVVTRALRSNDQKFLWLRVKAPNPMRFTRVETQEVVGFESRKGVGRRYGAVEQCDEFSVARIEYFVDREVAAHVDVQSAQPGDVDIAA